MDIAMPRTEPHTKPLLPLTVDDVTPTQPAAAATTATTRPPPRPALPVPFRVPKPKPGHSSSGHTHRTKAADRGGDHSPWTHTGSRLERLGFPLGGIGTGTVVLQGDGSLGAWNVGNRFAAPHGRVSHHPPPLNPARDGHVSAGTCCFAIAAAYDDDDAQENDPNEKDTSKKDTSKKDHPAPRPSLLLRSAHHRPTGRRRRGKIRKNGVLPPNVPSLSVTAQYPIATVAYETPPSFPLADVTLEALTPLIPSDARASGSPLVVFTLRVRNPHPTKTVSVDAMQSLVNFVGWDGGHWLETMEADGTKGQLPECLYGGNTNEPFVYHSGGPGATLDGATDDDGGHACTGLFLHTQQDLKEDLTRKGSLAIAALHRSNNSKSRRPHGTNRHTTTNVAPTVALVEWVASETELFRRFRHRDFDDPRKHPKPTPPTPKHNTCAGAVVQSLDRIPPGATAELVFVLSWHFPYRPCTAPRPNLPKDFYGNLYATWFHDAREVVHGLVDAYNRAERSAEAATTKHPVTTHRTHEPTSTKKNPVEITRAFVKTLYGTTLPFELLESAAGRLAIARSPTLFRTEQGICLGNEANGVGPLNCTHVYGSSTLLERVFPELARDMLTSVFVRNFDASKGGCQTRFGTGGCAIDGALACVAKALLVVQQSDPGLDFVKTIWPNLKQQIERVLDPHCLDAKTGLVAGRQETTHGLLEGPHPLVGSYLVTALRAGEVLATKLGDVNFAKKCAKQARASAEAYDRACWNEDLGCYTAAAAAASSGAGTDRDDDARTFGSHGCCVDQLGASGLSRACGLGPVFSNPEREATARRTIVRNNAVHSPPFADADGHLRYGEKGLRVCSYPLAPPPSPARPSDSDRVASGFEYGLAAGLVADGNWEDALRVCAEVRHRHSGISHSPWDEPEAGRYAARSLSGWNLLDPACGWAYDCTSASVGFVPAGPHTASFRCLCTFHDGFGEISQQTSGDPPGFSSGTVQLRALYGSIEVETIRLGTTAHVVVATLDDNPLPASIDATGVVTLDSKVAIPEDSVLKLVLTSPCVVNTTETTTYLDRSGFWNPSLPAMTSTTKVLDKVSSSSRNEIKRCSGWLGCMAVTLWILFGVLILNGSVFGTILLLPIGIAFGIAIGFERIPDCSSKAPTRSAGVKKL